MCSVTGSGRHWDRVGPRGGWKGGRGAISFSFFFFFFLGGGGGAGWGGGVVFFLGGGGGFVFGWFD